MFGIDTNRNPLYYRFIREMGFCLVSGYSPGELLVSFFMSLISYKYSFPIAISISSRIPDAHLLLL